MGELSHGIHLHERDSLKTRPVIFHTITPLVAHGMLSRQTTQLHLSPAAINGGFAHGIPDEETRAAFDRGLHGIPMRISM